LKEPVKKLDIDQAAGVIMPFFDNDTNMLYLCGKGDGNVRFYESTNQEPYLFGLSEFRSTTSCKG
jgi:coronin-1B/1C/6